MTLALIDGSNVLHSSAWRKRSVGTDDHAARAALVDAVANWVAVSPEIDQAVLTLDGAGLHGAGEHTVSDRLTVVATGRRSADSVIELRAADEARAGATWWVVSDDRQVRSVAGARADRTLSTVEFVRLVTDDDPSPDTPPVEPQGPSGMAGNLSDDVRARLEQMRRGEA